MLCGSHAGSCGHYFEGHPGGSGIQDHLLHVERCWAEHLSFCVMPFACELMTNDDNRKYLVKITGMKNV